jgi:F-box and WD-40 domain protein CDC4
MRSDVLVTGGSDGSVRVWSLENYQPIHRLAAHDNSVTSLQFDETRIVSGGSDGRVKVWDLKKGTLVRELSSPAEAVWRVVFEEEKAVIMASRAGKTVMEVRTLARAGHHCANINANNLQVWSFSPPDDEYPESFRSGSPASMPDHAMLEYQASSEGFQSSMDVAAPEETTTTDAAVEVEAEMGAESKKDGVERSRSRSRSRTRGTDADVVDPGTADVSMTDAC